MISKHYAKMFIPITQSLVDTRVVRHTYNSFAKVSPRIVRRINDFVNHLVQCFYFGKAGYKFG